MTPKYLESATKTTLLLLVIALIIFVGFSIEIPEIFSNVVLAVIGFYFGQKTNQIATDETN